jgi:NADPH2:quinone reductase
LRALVCHTLGEPANLRVEERPALEPGAGEIVVAVQAAGVNWPDMLMVRGKYQRKPALPFTPGMELAGVVARVGPDVSGFAVGERVMAHLPDTGAFAEEALVRVGPGLVKLPPGVDFVQAACLPLAYATSLEALAEARVQPGETVLVLGAAGGVGLAAVQIARILGARVIACASSEEKLALCRAAGASDTIHYETADFAQELKRLTGDTGVHVVLDPVGGRFAEAALRRMARHGRYLVVGFTAGIPSIPLNLVLLKCCTVIGVALGMRKGQEPDAYGGRLEQLAAWVAQGKLQPHIGHVCSLAQAPQALAAFEQRAPLGKTVVTMA